MCAEAVVAWHLGERGGRQQANANSALVRSFLRCLAASCGFLRVPALSHAFLRFQDVSCGLLRFPVVSCCFLRFPAPRGWCQNRFLIYGSARCFVSVSYTHLRAHETSAHL
eukprot:4207636-Alexandrium_andersonii.AAC.1